jgi:membrane protein required for colicin V production
MTGLDVFVLLLVGGIGVRGFTRGFVMEALSLGAWIAAIVAVKALHAPVSTALTDMVGTQSGAAILAFALIFGVTFMAGRVAASRIGKASRTSILGGFDRVLGLGFGALKGLVGASIVFLVASLIYNTIYGGGSERPEWVETSRSYPLLNATSRAIVNFVDQRQADTA